MDLITAALCTPRYPGRGAGPYRAFVGPQAVAGLLIRCALHPGRNYGRPLVGDGLRGRPNWAGNGASRAPFPKPLRPA